MMTDKQLRFSENQTLSSEATSTNTIDAGAPDIGVGRNLDLYVVVKGAPATALTVALQTADTESMTGATVVASYTVDAAIVQQGGRVLGVRVPEGCGRYLSLKYSGPAGGTVSAGLVKDS